MQFDKSAHTKYVDAKMQNRINNVNSVRFMFMRLVLLRFNKCTIAGSPFEETEYSRWRQQCCRRRSSLKSKEKTKLELLFLSLSQYMTSTSRMLGLKMQRARHQNEIHSSALLHQHLHRNVLFILRRRTVRCSLFWRIQSLSYSLASSRLQLPLAISAMPQSPPPLRTG